MGDGGCSAFGGRCAFLVCRVWLLCGGEGGSVVMAFLVRVGMGLVMLLLYVVWLRFVVILWWVLVSVVPACVDY